MREGCTPTPARARHSEPKGDLMADPRPLPHHAQALLPAGDPGGLPLPPSSLASSASAHTQLFIASGSTPTTRRPLPFNRHRAPAHTHGARAPQHRRLPLTSSSPTHPAGEEAVLPGQGCLWCPPSYVLAPTGGACSPRTRARKGLTVSLSYSQPNRWPPKEPGIQVALSPTGSPYVPGAYTLVKRAPTLAKP